MPNTNFQTIVFDLGGVLIDWNPRYLYRKIFSSEAEVEHFLTHICTGDWNEQQDAGRPLQEATESLVAQHPDREQEIRAYYGRWTEMLNGVIEGTEQILRELAHREQYRLFALTNWSAETFPHAWERYDCLRVFSDILVSGKEGLKKPDPRIYHLLFERFGILPEQALFIDDNLRNVRASIECGMQALHFQGPEALRSDLSRLGVL